jgi:hypothetical protein
MECWSDGRVGRASPALWPRSGGSSSILTAASLEIKSNIVYLNRFNRD